MIKIRYILAFTLLSFSVFGLFQIKFKVQQLHNEALELKSQLAHEKDSIHVLKAEWAYLNQPERLHRLSKKFLDLAEVKSDQVLPVKPGSIITLVKESEDTEGLENKNLVKVSYNKNSNRKKAVKWNYKERPALKTRSKK